MSFRCCGKHIQCFRECEASGSTTAARTSGPCAKESCRTPILNKQSRVELPKCKPGRRRSIRRVQKPWSFRLCDDLPCGVAVLGDRQLVQGALSVNQNWQQVETAASWKSCSLTGLRRPFRGARGSWLFRLYGGLPRGVAVLCDRRPMVSCICTPARRIPRRPSNLTCVAVPHSRRKHLLHHISSTTISTNGSMEPLGGRRGSATGNGRDFRSCLGHLRPDRQQSAGIGTFSALCLKRVSLSSS